VGLDADRADLRAGDQTCHLSLLLCWAVIAPVEHAVVARLFDVLSLPVMNVAGTG